MNKNSSPSVIDGMKTFFYLTALFLAYSQAQETPTKQTTESSPTINDDPFAENSENHEDEYVPPILIHTIEYIELPLTEIPRLLFDENLIADSVKLRAALDVMLKNGKAKMYDVIATVGTSSIKCNSESIEEMIYPTEYEPAEIPNSVQLPKDEVITDKTLSAIDALKTQPNPTAFEPRNVGNTFEAESYLSNDEAYVTSKIIPEFVKFCGWAKFNEETDLRGNHSDIRMPRFNVMRLSSEVNIPLGKPQFLGIHSAPSQEGPPDPNRKIIAMMRCHLIKPPLKTK